MRPEVVPVERVAGFHWLLSTRLTCMQNGNIVWLLQNTMCRYSLQTYFLPYLVVLLKIEPYLSCSYNILSNIAMVIILPSTYDGNQPRKTPSLSETNRPQTPRRLGGKLPPKKTAGLRAFEPKATA